MARLPWSFLVAAASLLALAFVLLQDSFDSPDAHNALWAPGSVGHSSSLLDTQDAIVEARVQQLLAKERARLGLSAAGRDSGPEDSDAGTGHALASAVQHGEVIMPKLPNATAKCAPPPSRLLRTPPPRLTDPRARTPTHVGPS